MKIVRSSLKCWLTRPGQDRICLRSLAARNGFRLGEMCDELGCSERYLRRVFMNHLGLSPATWLRHERMVEARHRLREGAHPAGLAHELGYASVSSFGRLFKATYGVGPRTYQRQSLCRNRTR